MDPYIVCTGSVPPAQGWPQNRLPTLYTSNLDLCSAVYGRTAFDMQSGRQEPANVGCFCGAPTGMLQCSPGFGDSSFYNSNALLANGLSFELWCAAYCRCTSKPIADGWAASGLRGHATIIGGLINYDNGVLPYFLGHASNGNISCTAEPEPDCTADSTIVSNNDTDPETPTTTPGDDVFFPGAVGASGSLGSGGAASSQSCQAQAPGGCSNAADCSNGTESSLCRCIAEATTVIRPGVNQYRSMCHFGITSGAGKRRSTTIGRDLAIRSINDMDQRLLDELPCPCNRTYVSHGCCNAGDGGLVWEAASECLGYLKDE